MQREVSRRRDSRSMAIREFDQTITFPETWRGNEHSVLRPAAKFPHSRNMRPASVKGRDAWGLPGVVGHAESSLLHSEFAIVLDVVGTLLSDTRKFSI